MWIHARIHRKYSIATQRKQWVLNRYPGSSSRLPQSMILSMWLQWSEVEHGRNHLITSQWCEPLTSAKEITINANDSQGTRVHSSECEYIVWCWIVRWIFQPKVNDVNLFSKERKSFIGVYKSQVTSLFLRLIPAIWVEVDRISLIEGGPWWIPHQRHETWNKVLEFEYEVTMVPTQR